MSPPTQEGISREQCASYIDHHDLRTSLQSAISTAISENAPNALQRIAEILVAKVDGKEASPPTAHVDHDMIRAGNRSEKSDEAKQLTVEFFDAARAELKWTKTADSSFGPMRPTASEVASLATANGPLKVHGGVVWQAGPFRSHWLRVGAVSGTDRLVVWESLRKLIERLTELGQRESAARLASASAPKPGAVYVCVAQKAANSVDLEWLTAQSFTFYRYRKDPRTAGEAHALSEAELVYMCEPYDASLRVVPPYATAYEGGHALVLSPDGTKVCLAWEGERNMWGGAGGHVEVAEGLVDAIEREVGEEIGLKFDHSHGVKLIGGHQTAAQRDGHINSAYWFIGVRSTSLDFQLAGNEVSLAHWFEVDALLAAFNAAGKPKKFDLPEAMRVPGHPDKKIVNANNAKGLEALLNGKYLEGRMEDKGCREWRFGAR